MHFRFPDSIELFKGRQVVGLSCVINADNNHEFISVVLIRRKGLLEIESIKSFSCDFEKLYEHIPTELPVMLSLDGKGILHKKVTVEKHEDILKQIMPGSNKDDFMIDVCEGMGKDLFVSLARHDYLNSIFKKLIPGLFVIDLTINPLHVKNLSGIFNELPLSITSGYYEIQTNESGFIKEYRKRESYDQEEVSYRFDDYEIGSGSLLSFYNALKFFIGNKNDQLPAEIESQRSEFQSWRLFIFAGISALVIIFIILILNFAIFFRLSERKAQLDQTLMDNKGIVEIIDSLKKEVTWKEKFLGKSGFNQNRWFSYMADDLGASVPINITLKKIEIHPVDAKITMSKEIGFRYDILRISGVAGTSNLLNQWIIKLRELRWISDVVVENFLQMDNTAAGNFIIEIKIK